MVTQNHFVIPATVLEKFRFQRVSPDLGVTVPAFHCTPPCASLSYFLSLQHSLRRHRGIHGAVVAMLGAGARPAAQRTLRPLRPARQRELHYIER